MSLQSFHAGTTDPQSVSRDSRSYCSKVVFSPLMLIDDFDLSKVNKLLLLTQSAHLMVLNDHRELDARERNRARAKLIRSHRQD